MKVTEFTRANSKEVIDRLQEVLNGFSEELGLTFTINGGRLSTDKLTLKVEVTIPGDNGCRVVSDRTNASADRAASAADVHYHTPHIIGSVWEIRSGLCKVIDYKSANRRYPFIVKNYESGKTYKVNVLAFCRGTEIVPPTKDDFKKWFTIDVEDDTISAKDEEICDRVNSYFSVKYDGDEDFFNACGEAYELGVADKVWEVAYETYAALDNPKQIATAINALIANIKKAKKSRRK